MKDVESFIAAIGAIEAAIEIVDEQATSILDCYTIGTGRDPSTMDDDGRAEYERLLSIEKRARCGLTILSRMVFHDAPAQRPSFPSDPEGRN